MHELVQSWGGLATRLMVRIPQLATEAGLGAWPIAALALLAGVALLIAGVRLGPLLTGTAGAVIGWVVASRHPLIAASWGIPAAAEAWVASAVAGLACAFAPALYPILLGALPGAAWGVGVPVAGRAWIGGAAAALVFGALSYALRRLVFAATAAFAGALLVDASVLVLAARFPFLRAVTSRPTLFAALTAVLVVAGAAAQLSTQDRGGRGGRDRDARGRRLRQDD